MATWTKSRQTRYGAYLFVYVIVILAIVGAANWLAANNNKSFDSTANKRFSLSDQTKKIVGGLKNDVTVYFFDKAGNYDQARDMFDRYSNLSSKFKPVYVDPDKKPDVAKLEGARAFGDIIIDNGIKKEAAKSLTEEEITGALIRVSRSGIRQACFVKGSGEHSLEDQSREGYSIVKSALEKNNYKTLSISLIEKPEIPQECNVVIVGGPRRDYLQPVIDTLKKFVAGGGKIIVAFDPVLALPQEKMGDTPALAAMVADWGVTTKGDVIIDSSSASQVFGATSPVVGSYGTHIIVRSMRDNASVFPMSRSLTVKSPAEVLFSTTAESSSLTNPKIPITSAEIDKAPKGPFVIGVAATIGTGDKAGRVVVTGSAEWMGNTIMSSPLANRDLFLNMMNWLTSDEDLISIRPKDPEDRRLNISSNGILLMRSVSIFLLPAFVILAGISVWWKRR